VRTDRVTLVTRCRFSPADIAVAPGQMKGTVHVG
jgi:hypothetical protein